MPGAKRPWLIESEDDSHPLPDFGATAGAGDGVRRVTTPIGPAGVGLNGGPALATVGPVLATVIASSAAAPHAGQNRADSGSVALQREQITVGFYTGPGSEVVLVDVALV